MITTKDIIKALPLEDDVKNMLLENFDTFDYGKKFVLEEMIWEYYDTLYNMRLQANVQAALEELKGKEKKDEKFMLKIRQKTDKEMEQELEKSLAQTDISSIRSSLQKIAEEDQVKKKLEKYIQPATN